ncbi:hypothetical protein FRC07_003693, partial [Ceratobasidium sp. 392]
MAFPAKSMPMNLPEIILAVSRFLTPSEIAYSLLRLNRIAFLSLVSLIWENIPHGLQVLLQLVMDENFPTRSQIDASIEVPLDLVASAAPERWERFTNYAHFVRTLSVYPEWNGSEIGPYRITPLSIICPHTHALPKLDMLEIHALHGPHTYSVIRDLFSIFACQTLRKVRLNGQFTGVETCTLSHALVPLIENATLLEELQLTPRRDGGHLDLGQLGHMLDLATSVKRLTLGLPLIQQVVFAVVGRLPHLTHLILLDNSRNLLSSVFHSDPFQSFRVMQGSFANLTKLTTVGKSWRLSYLATLISAVSFATNLKEVDLDGHGSESDATQLFEALKFHAPLLHSIKLSIKGFRGRHTTIPIACTSQLKSIALSCLELRGTTDGIFGVDVFLDSCPIWRQSLLRILAEFSSLKSLSILLDISKPPPIVSGSNVRPVSAQSITIEAYVSKRGLAASLERELE